MMRATRLEIIHGALVGLNAFLESLDTDSIPDECERAARYAMVCRLDRHYFPSALPLCDDELRSILMDSYPSQR